MKKPGLWPSLALTLLSATATAQAPTQSQSQGVPTPAQGGTTVQPSYRVREPKNDGGMNEVPPKNPIEPDSTTSPPQRTVVEKGDLRAPASQSFVTAATQLSLTEIELAKLAMDRSSRADVKQFAQAMVQDHTRTNAELKPIANHLGLSIPASVDLKQAALIKDMSSTSGKDFDREYIKQMVEDQAKALALFRAESAVSKDPLQVFAQKTLAPLQKHKRMADQLAAT